MGRQSKDCSTKGLPKADEALLVRGFVAKVFSAAPSTGIRGLEKKTFSPGKGPYGKEYDGSVGFTSRSTNTSVKQNSTNQSIPAEPGDAKCRPHPHDTCALEFYLCLMASRRHM